MKIFNALAWIVIVLFLIFLLVPMLDSPSGYPNYRLTQANNMKQITTMMVVHRTESREAWPNPWKNAGVDFPVVQSAEEAKMVTAMIFEYLASTYDLNPNVFNDPKTHLPNLKRSKRSAKEIIEDPNVNWAENYAFDWSAMKTAGTLRPVMCLRQPIDSGEIFIYADGHIQWLDAIVATRGKGIRTSQKGQQWSILIADDDIFSPRINEDGTYNKAAFTFAANDSDDVWMK